MTHADIRGLDERLVTYPLNIQDPSVGKLLIILAGVVEAVNDSDCIGYGYGNILGAVAEVDDYQP